MPELFDTRLRALRRDRAARLGPELFLFERVFADCLERIALCGRRFERALLLGCPDPDWPERLGTVSAHVDVRDPGSIFAERSEGGTVTEDEWEPPQAAYDLVVAIGTLDTVNDLPLALQLLRYGMQENGLLIGAISGGDTLPRLRSAMRAADALSGTAAPHLHPRIEAAALAPLLERAGFLRPVVDIDRFAVSYGSFARLIGDLRAMGANNMLRQRARFINRRAQAAAERDFQDAGNGTRTIETFEILHFAAWTPSQP